MIMANNLFVITIGVILYWLQRIHQEKTTIICQKIFPPKQMAYKK